MPLRITRWRGALGIPVTRLHYRRVDVDLERLDKGPLVVKVLTTSPGERTASGIGVGSPISAAARLPGAHCWSEAAPTSYCQIGNPNKPLSRVTTFWSGRDKRVTLISVSLAVNS